MPLFVSPYILRAAMRAERLEKKLAANDHEPKENGGPSTFDEKAAAMPKNSPPNNRLKNGPPFPAL